MNCVLQKARAASVELYVDNGQDGGVNKETALALWKVVEGPLRKAFPNTDIECDTGVDRGKRMSRISVVPRGLDECGYASAPDNRQKMAAWLATASGTFYGIVKPAVASFGKRS